MTLITAHSSKGLEWPVVFNTITNYDSTRLHSNSSHVTKDIEETRRLLFVSTTRARDLLCLTGVYVAYGSEKEGYIYNQFVKELYEIMDKFYDLVDHEKEAERDAKREAAKLKRSQRKARCFGQQLIILLIQFSQSKELRHRISRWRTFLTAKNIFLRMKSTENETNKFDC